MRIEALRTNRDLCTFVTRLVEANQDTDRLLEEYLRALFRLGAEHRAMDALSVPLFAELLERAFREAPGPFLASWRRTVHTSPHRLEGYARWEQTIVGQIVDLCEMSAAGQLDRPTRHLGVDSPRGSRWYNFDPLAFLESGAAGAFGGLGASEDARRPSAPDGVLAGPDILRALGASLGEPALPVESIRWEQFADFLGAGQWLE